MLLRIVQIAVVLAGFSLAACEHKAAIEEVSTFGPLALGQVAPHFTAVASSGEEFNSPLPPGKFTAYCIQNSLPPSCLDDGCGPAGQFVRNKGGRLVGICDLKGAGVFGVKGRPGHNAQLETSLVVLCDTNQRIVAIYKGATMADVESLVRRSNL